MQLRVYIVNSDETFGSVMAHCMEQEGWQVQVFADNSEPLSRVDDCPNLWILDADGEEWFKIMRKIKNGSNNVPVILTAEKEQIMNRVLGLEFGCEDFVVKPFLPREMILRIKRIFERTLLVEKQLQENIVKLQEFCLDSDNRVVTYYDQSVPLTAKEFSLLMLFCRHKGIALSREQIIRYVWGENYFGSDRVVDDLIRRMRKKIAKLKVETLYGYGYRIIS